MSGWSVPIQRLADRAGLSLETVTRKITLDVFRSVILQSPVDTGRFRANWNVSSGTPNYTVTNSTNAARGEAEASQALTLPIGGVTYLTNGLPYARRLEYGYSKQAPQGMVRLTLQRVRSMIDGARL